MASTTPPADPADKPGPDAGGDEQLRRFLHEAVMPFDPAGSADHWTSASDLARARARDEIFLKGFGADALAGPPAVHWGPTLDRDPGYTIRKLRFEAFADYWVPALLYEPTTPSDVGGRVGVLNADGHHDAGVAAGYKQRRCIGLVRRGCVVMNFEFIGMGELAADSDFVPGQGASLHSNLAALELVGIGAAAPMFLAMTRALDVLVDLPTVDPQRVAMTGLSGGGWQTIVLCALDQRVAASIPVAGYTSLAARIDESCDVGDIEQVPADLGVVFDYQAMTAAVSPRPMLIVLNEHDDCCFRTERTKPVVYDAVRPVFEAFGAGDRFEFHNNVDPGTHNYGEDNRRRLYQFLARHLGVADVVDDSATVDEPDEVLDEHELRIGLPADQVTLRDIALAAARRLRTERANADPDSLLARVRRVLRLPEYPAAAPDRLDPGAFTLDIGPWSLPAHWLASTSASTLTVLEVSDAGAAVGRTVGPTVGARLGLDLLGTGRVAVTPTLALLVAALGHRLLGLQIAQLIAATEALAASHGTVWVVADGPMASTAAMFAAALRPALSAGLTTQNMALRSFEDLITKGVRYHEAPSLFSPDILTVVDLDDLAPLITAGGPWHRGDRGGEPDGLVIR